MDSPLWSLVPDYAESELNWKPRNFVHYDVWKNWRTGERKQFPRSCGGLDEGAAVVWPEDYDYQFDSHFLWSCEKNDIDGSLNFEPSACVGDESAQKTHSIRAGETEIYKNGSVVVSCKRFEGRLQRVSTPVSGCFYNNTVYPLGAHWSEPNIGDSQTLHRFMTCYKSESGYFEKRVAGHQQRLQILRSRPPNRRCYCDQLCQSRYRYKLEDTATGTNRILSFIFSQRSWGLSIELTMTRSLIKSTRMVISIRETGNKTPLNLILEISLDSRKLDLPGRPRWRRRKQDGKEQEKMDNNLNIMALPFNFSLDYPRCC
ncbi:Protein CBG17249 [Caenorhabditis briggsae]|uniref:Protein CBG17249 n=3 Tax=Caenorhabditis briggsae TaxID=6238 RepID=A8XQH6_CAEBR|nr:Protein CBG17249 [Caenorhabditis briggsae]CAP34901.1 Protein CBG17249 [Caenorhabditis briggsae]